MAVKGIGSNYLYPVQNDYKLDSKTEDTKNAVSQTAVQKEGVSYEKTIPDSVDRKSTRLNSSHTDSSRMPSSA